MASKLLDTFKNRRATREFWSPDYLRHNQRRQEHLASLGVPIAGRSVLEVGAGLGDHTTFFLDRDCKVVITEARPNNVSMLERRFPDERVVELDLDVAVDEPALRAEVVYCYGTLYHLSRPVEAIRFLAHHCSSLLLLETVVDPATGSTMRLVDEQQHVASQSFAGVGTRATRQWIVDRLSEHFPHVMLTRTQPWHDEFPLDWENHDHALHRAVFVASRERLDLPTLTEGIPQLQVRH